MALWNSKDRAHLTVYQWGFLSQPLSRVLCRTVSRMSQSGTYESKAVSKLQQVLGQNLKLQILLAVAASLLEQAKVTKSVSHE